jgi:hypothetical protein
MADSLASLRTLAELKRIQEGLTGREINVDQLTKDFLAFSQFNPDKTLNVKVPKLYPIEGDEIKHFQEFLDKAGIDAKSPKAIGIGGAFSCRDVEDYLVFASLNQLKADPFDNTRYQFAPLFEKVFTDGALLIRDFALNEVLFGKFYAKRGDLDLRKAALKPRTFVKGPYTLGVTLDTPSESVAKIIKFRKTLDEMIAEPKRFLLDVSKVDALTDTAIKLRQKIGSPSRYNTPESNTFDVMVNSICLRNNGDSYFFLYNPREQKNVLVYFGNPLFRGDTPKESELTILDGEDHQETLKRLVELGFFKPNQTVLEQRIRDVQKIHDVTVNASNKEINQQEHEDFFRLKDKLETARAVMDRKDERTQRDYALQQPAEILEFMISPTVSDAVIDELHPMLSWNSAIRIYHQTNRFKKQFVDEDEEGRKNMIRAVTSNLMLTNYQNNDVNLWIYNNYKALAESTGVKFKIFGIIPADTSTSS